LQAFHQRHIRPLNENFFLHLTPEFGGLTKEQNLADGRYYKYMNKPYGLRHWMEQVLRMNETDHSPDVEDGIVFLLDPDMVLLRPLVHDFTNEDVMFVEEEPKSKIVKHGMTMAQQDGYLNSMWMNLNISYVTNGGNINNLQQKDGSIYYNTGPPYLATVRDMYNIAKLWTEYAPRVYDIHPKLFAEMFGYIIATTQLHLPHTLIRSIVVSTTTTSTREGWPYVDAIPPDQLCSPHPTAALPVGLHYCKRYLLDTWFFSKYRLKKKFISCETPLLTMPPLDLGNRNITFSLPPPPHGHDPPKDGEWVPGKLRVLPRQAKREAFMLCGMISAVNEAAIHFKQTACNGTANMATNYTFFSDWNH
jgi:hypothetical protein